MSGLWCLELTLTQVIGDIEARRAGVPNAFQVSLAFSKFARIDYLTFGKQYKLVE